MIREPHTVGGQESSGANAEAAVGLIRKPVLVGNECGIRLGSAGPDRRVRRLAPDCAICRPSVLLHGANEIEIHQEVQVLVSAGKADAQVGRTHLEPEMHRAERVSQHSIQECLLAMWSILGVGSRGRLATGRRELAMRQEPTVRRQQAATGRRVVARRAARVLLREEQWLGPGSRRNRDDAEQGEPAFWSCCSPRNLKGHFDMDGVLDPDAEIARFGDGIPPAGRRETMP